MSSSWVSSSLPPMLGPLPAWVVLPLPLVLLKFGVFSISVLIIFILVAVYLTNKGRTLIWTCRRLRTFLRGYKMIARPLGYRRAMRMDVAIHEFEFDKWRDS